jgi:hypothetical protein
MGDRCFVSIYAPASRRKDLTTHLDMSLWIDDSIVDTTDPKAKITNVADWHDDEVNYAGSVCQENAGLFQCLINAGVPFVGTHGAGDEYGPGVFAFDGTTWVYTESDDWGNPIIGFDMLHNSVDGLGLDRAVLYRRTYLAVLALIRKEATIA